MSLQTILVSGAGLCALLPFIDVRRHKQGSTRHFRHLAICNRLQALAILLLAVALLVH